MEYVAVGVISGIVGMSIGLLIMYLVYKCEHQWEEIIDDHYPGACTRVVVHMCKKCGKRKITRV